MATVKLAREASEYERARCVLSLRRTEELPRRLDLPNPRFVCLLAWDARGADGEVISTLVKRLLEFGAVYVCVWGPGCERVHDVVDEVAVGPDPSDEGQPVVMTTWHADEPLADAIHFALFAARPDSACEAGCDSILASPLVPTTGPPKSVPLFSIPGLWPRQAARAAERRDVGFLVYACTQASAVFPESL